MAVRVSATGQYLTSPTLPSRGITVACWVRAATLRGCIASMYAAGTFVQLRFSSDGTIALTVNTAITVGAASAATWYLAGFRVDSSGNVTGFFCPFGGSALTTATHTSQASTYDSAITLLDATTHYAYDWADARVQDFKVWTAALTDAEILAEMAQRAPVRTSGLWAYVPLTDISSLSDQSGNSHNLTATGTLTTEDGPTFPLSASYSGATGVVVADASAASAIFPINTAYTGTTGIVAGDASAVTINFPLSISYTGTTGIVVRDASGYSGGIPAMPRLQIGANVVGTGTPGLLVDGSYRGSYAWTCASGSWAAVDLGTDASRTQILVAMSNETDVSQWDQTTGLQNFTLRTSADSTDGTNGTWTNYPVTSYQRMYYARVLPFAGQRWLRLEVGSGAPHIDELEIWNATPGTSDTYLFLGDSITVRATKRGRQVGAGQQPNFQARILAAHGQYPMMAVAAVVGVAADWVDNNIVEAMATFPMAKHALISIGTNNAGYLNPTNLSAFETRLRSIVAKARAAGMEPMLARIPWTTDASYGGGTFGSDNTAQFNAIIDTVVSDLHLPPGPDLYTLAHTDSAVWYQNGDGGDGVHPGEEGCRQWAAAWADAVSRLYGSNAIFETYTGASGIVLADTSLAAFSIPLSASFMGTSGIILANVSTFSVRGAGAATPAARQIHIAALSGARRRVEKTFTVLPRERLDYQVVWDLLAPGETIVGSLWYVEAGTAQLGEGEDYGSSYTNTTSTVWVYGVTSRSVVTNVITTSTGRTYECRFEIRGP